MQCFWAPNHESAAAPSDEEVPETPRPRPTSPEIGCGPTSTRQLARTSLMLLSPFVGRYLLRTSPGRAQRNAAHPLTPKYAQVPNKYPKNSAAGHPEARRRERGPGQRGKSEPEVPPGYLHDSSGRAVEMDSACFFDELLAELAWFRDRLVAYNVLPWRF